MKRAYLSVRFHRYRTRLPKSDGGLVSMLFPLEAIASFGASQFACGTTAVCVLCGKEKESINHIFVGCSFARVVWTKMAARTHATLPLHSDVRMRMEKWRRHWPT
ncbi:hypothetical protein Taro_042989 [Colocasia esculenta]|uniref:Reverse transcriptase zinc-binding domain-containing protein n=1 Tax=Colocasia esculenta TaxID=4460 RepID=A0A843X3G2_COLES|nr:hypothetical protein [Colocasia esculenta]